MPRVSSEHLAARRGQIVSAALVCFSRNGFHATTMADVIEESGVSAGAVYRYFRGKEELVEAIAERALGAAGHALAELLADDETPDPADAVAHVVDALDAAAAAGPVDLRRVTLLAWAEALRAPGVHRAAAAAQTRLRRGLEQVVVEAQRTGRLPASLDVGAAGQLLQSLVVGRLVQQLVAPDVDAGSFGEAVWTLLNGASAAPDPAALLAARAAPATDPVVLPAPRAPEAAPPEAAPPEADPPRPRTAAGLGWP